MSISLILYIGLIAYITRPGAFFKIPFRQSFMVAFVHASIFFTLFIIGKPFLTTKEGYANNMPLFSDPSNMYNYCMYANRPPFMGSIHDTINNCLARISGTGYVPYSTKNTFKKVRFSV